MTKKKLKIENFAISNPTQEGDLCYNVQAKDGLDNCFGLVEAQLVYGSRQKPFVIPPAINKILGLYYHTNYNPNTTATIHRLCLYGDDGKFYIHQMFGTNYAFANMYGLSFANRPECLAYRYQDVEGVVYISTDKMYVWKGNATPYVRENAPAITSLCACENVLFATLKVPAYKIWYNRNMNLETVGEENDTSGYIVLDNYSGYARKVITFDEHVYVFRDYSISKISFYKDEMVVSEVYKSNTKIIEETIAACGNFIVFATSCGLFSFDGSSVKKIDVNFANLIGSLSNAVSTSLGKYYYLALKLDFDDDQVVLCESQTYVNNALIILNLEDLSYQIIRGVDIMGLLSLKTEKLETVLAYFNSGDTRTLAEIKQSSNFYTQVLPKYWRKKDLFKDNSSRLITGVVVNSEANVTFKLKIDNTIYSFTTTKNGLNKFHLKCKGNKVQLEILSSQLSSKVSSVEIEYYDC